MNTLSIFDMLNSGDSSGGYGVSKPTCREICGSVWYFDPSATVPSKPLAHPATRISTTNCLQAIPSPRFSPYFPIPHFGPRNGTDWAHASWRHVSDTGEVFSIQGLYGRVAPCPELSAEQAQAALNGLSSGVVSAPAITTRSRRQSDVPWENLGWELVELFGHFF